MFYRRAIFLTVSEFPSKSHFRYSKFWHDIQTGKQHKRSYFGSPNFPLKLMTSSKVHKNRSYPIGKRFSKIDIIEPLARSTLAPYTTQLFFRQLSTRWGENCLQRKIFYPYFLVIIIIIILNLRLKIPEGGVKQELSYRKQIARQLHKH